VPKRNLAGLDDRIFILDFFGSRNGLRGPNQGISQSLRLNIPLRRFLTAFGARGNTFLGYFMTNSSSRDTTGASDTVRKLDQGVIWGKDSKHFVGMEGLLRQVAKDVQLVSTSTAQIVAHSNIRWAGHQTADGWLSLLRQSKFLIGLGNPILGPSAIDAIAMGCVFINPVYDKPVEHNGFPFTSQHPYAEKLGAPYVCNYHQHSVQQLQECIKTALGTTLPHAIPSDFTMEAHRERVKAIFDL
jgi:hypothetical protein